jgi:hypothetical protein
VAHRRQPKTGVWGVKKFAIAIAVCSALFASPVQAKTFVAVLWPMFGPLPAIGLVELTAEIKMMPDVDVETYVHQAWPSLVDDLDKLPPGTHTVVVGYSLGANSTVFVANNAKHVDTIIALQPSMLSWNPPLDPGKVGRMIEVYNPNPWLTWGGMGSKKLEGDNIEYIANSDSHPGAQFNSDFRNLVKNEIAKFTAQDREEERNRVETAQAAPLAPAELAQPAPAAKLAFAEEQPAPRPGHVPAKDRPPIARAAVAKPPKPATPEQLAQQPPKPAAPKQPAASEAVAQDLPKTDRRKLAAFLDSLSGSVNSGDLSGKRELTLGDLTNYAKRTYGASRTAGNFSGKESSAAGDDVIAAALSRDGSL